jgi:hypothetical protein
MGLDSLLKPKGKLTLRAPDNCLPGQLIPMEIWVSAEEEIKPREVRAELAGAETYYVTETHHDAKGRIQTHTVKKNEIFAAIVQTVAEQPFLSQGTEQKWNVSMQLPADAACTSQGKLVNIRWTLKAVLDVPKRSDLSQEKPLMVFCQPAKIGDTSILLAEKTFNEVTLLLKAPAVAVVGDTVKGQLTLQIKDKLNIRSIRVELVRLEEAGTNRGDEVVAKTQIESGDSFNQNESRSFDFSLSIPAAAPPTVTGKHSSLRWKLKAVLDRKMKSDFSVEQELLVYNALRA